MNSKAMILKEGYVYIIISFAVSLLSFILICDTLGLIFLIITAVVLYTYRNPNRYIFENSSHVLSPVDGTVTAIDHVNGKHKIYCSVGICDASLVKAPSDSSLKIKKYQNGLNLDPDSYKGNLLNEQIIYKFDNMKLKLISGLCNPKIVFSDACEVKQGEDVAVFVQGSAVITLKEKKELHINIGDKLKAGQSVICR